MVPVAVETPAFLAAFVIGVKLSPFESIRTLCANVPPATVQNLSLISGYSYEKNND